MKEPKFIRLIRARLLDANATADYAKGVNQACNEMVKHYAETPMLNPAQVGYKRITPIHKRHEREKQELADLLAKERNENAKLIEWRRKLGELDEESQLPFGKLIDKLRSQLVQVKKDLAMLREASSNGVVAIPKKQLSARYVAMQSENLRLHVLVRELQAANGSQNQN